MKVAYPSETLAEFKQPRRCYIPEDGTHHNYHSENLKSCNFLRNIVEKFTDPHPRRLRIHLHYMIYINIVKEFVIKI
jgi:hypothetical protein